MERRGRAGGRRGHIVSESTFANTHAKAKKNFLLLCDEFGDKVKKAVYINETGRDARKISLDDLRELPELSAEEIKEKIRHAPIDERQEFCDGQTKAIQKHFAEVVIPNWKKQQQQAKKRQTPTPKPTGKE